MFKVMDFAEEWAARAAKRAASQFCYPTKVDIILRNDEL